MEKGLLLTTEQDQPQRWEVGFVDVCGTSGCKGRPDGRDVRMEGTSGWKARPDERHVRMEGTPGWKGRPNERHTALTTSEGVDEVEGCEDGDELRKKTFLEKNIQKQICLSTNNVYVKWSRGRFGDEPDY
uniref:Uncharacterized protein n=1 Tax=Tanacetum cinerariifolium TaxID=118510 RepID=A0A6L2NH82_TANCI|nr:hypothetical protein [Tanacetum cinerariifolium]